MKKSKAENAIPRIDVEIDPTTKSTIEIPVTIAFKYKTKKSPLYGKTIAWWTKSPYYHVELILFNKYWISASWNEDVYIRYLGPLKESWDYVTLKPLKIETHQAKGIIDYINSQNGSKYDKLGIFFSQIFKFNINSDKNWICSEIATFILELLGVKPFYTQNACKNSPGDMYKILEADINKVIETNKPYGFIKDVVLNSKK